MRSAIALSSRRARRYQGVTPSASDTWRKARSPASGLGPSANQPSIAGSSCRWISAWRDMPADSAAMWRSAASASAYPSAVRRVFAAAVVSRTASEGIRATASSSGE